MVPLKTLLQNTDICTPYLTNIWSEKLSIRNYVTNEKLLK